MMSCCQKELEEGHEGKSTRLSGLGHMIFMIIIIVIVHLLLIFTVAILITVRGGGGRFLLDVATFSNANPKSHTPSFHLPLPCSFR